MNVDVEQASFTTALEETFFDAVEDAKFNLATTLDPESLPVGCDNEGDVDIVNTSDMSIRLLNETYSLSTENSTLLDNPLPLLDDAIKSIQVHPTDPVIYLRNTPPISANTLSLDEDLDYMKHSDLITTEVRETSSEVSLSQKEHSNIGHTNDLLSFPVEFHGVEEVDVTLSADRPSEGTSDHFRMVEFRGVSDRCSSYFNSENYINILSNGKIVNEAENEQELVPEQMEVDVDKLRDTVKDSERICRLDDTTLLQVESFELDASHEIDESNIVQFTSNKREDNSPEKTLESVSPDALAEQECLKINVIEDDINELKMNMEDANDKVGTEKGEAEKCLFDILEEHREKRKPNPPKRILTAEEDAARNKWPRLFYTGVII